jgi:hypothetical protein
VGRKPRRAPRDVPDSLPKRDEGTDVVPDQVRSTDPPQEKPDSPPSSDENRVDCGTQLSLRKTFLSYL